MKTEQGKVNFHRAQGWLLKSESDIQPRYESGHPLVLARRRKCHYHSRNRSAPRRLGLPKREAGLWPEKGKH
jgi:hypothetical protein